MNGQTLVKAFVPLTVGATAVYTSSGLSYYRHSDWLGSSRVASTTTGGVYYDGAYAPFGEPYAESGTPDRSFTGQTQDTVSDAVAGLYDFMFREYRPTFGRWISPDPAGLAAVNPANPQSWNRYAYVQNNPMIFIDPLGLTRCYDTFVGSDKSITIREVQCPSEDTATGGLLGQILWENVINGGLGLGSRLVVVTEYEPRHSLDHPHPANNGSWAWNFTKSFFKDFSLSTEPGTCLGKFMDTTTAPLKQLRSAAQQYVPLITSAMQAGPAGASWYVTQVNNMVQSGAAEPDPQLITTVTTAGALASQAAPIVKSLTPYGIAITADGILLNGLVQEVKAGMNGQCTW